MGTLGTRGRLWVAALAVLMLATPGAVDPEPAAAETLTTRWAGPERSCTARTPVARRPRLVQGMVGTCVQTLQNLVLTHGYSIGYGWPGGAYDARTRTAVEAFQRAQGLEVDGVVGPRTWEALVTAPLRDGYSMWRGPNATDRVVLSYDDCPDSLAAFRRTLLAAEDAGLALVLFPTGQCLRIGRFDAAFARRHGHWVFNHSVNHPDMRRLSLPQVRAELRAPGVVTSYGRPPYGAMDATVLRGYAAQDMRIWMWTYDTNDWRGVSARTVISRVVDNATRRSAVLMHMQWHGFSPDAIRAMKRGLDQRGLEVCRNRGIRSAVAPARVRC